MRASRGEVKIAEILEMNGINFKEEVEFPDLKSSNGNPLRFDFAIYNDDDTLDFLIEYQGKQHYEAVSKYGGSKGFHRQRYNDNMKRRYCVLNDIKLIEIPYTEENLITFDYIWDKGYS